MKALVKFGTGIDGAGILDVAVPEPRDDELLVKVMAAGFCGTDDHILRDEYPYNPPVILGHEFAGIVTAVGKEVSGFEIGDQVISMTAAVTCGVCEYCRRGLPMLCNQRKSIGSGVDGAMAEYIAIPASIAFRVGADASAGDAMALAEPFCCAIRAVLEQTDIRPGDVVLVSGPGTLGQFAVILAKLAGAYVIASGLKHDEERLAMSLELGADEVCVGSENLEKVLRNKTEYGADVAFECSGASGSLETCIRSLKKTGQLTQIGLFGKKIEVDIDGILYKEIKYNVSFATARSSWEKFMRLSSQGRLNGMERLVSARIPLSDWREAYSLFLSKTTYKILLIP